jgi:hypothetical protein
LHTYNMFHQQRNCVLGALQNNLLRATCRPRRAKDFSFSEVGNSENTICQLLSCGISSGRISQIIKALPSVAPAIKGGVLQFTVPFYFIITPGSA